MSNSSPASTDSSIWPTSASPPKSENCPAASALRSATIGPDTLSCPIRSARRRYPSESNAPARIRDSNARFVSTEGSTLRQKSEKDSKRPLDARASITCWTAASPTFRTADSP